MGIVTDIDKNPIPYAAVGIPSKYIGTATTEDGTFLFLVSNAEMMDSLEVSSIGFKTYRIQIRDFLVNDIGEIILEDDIVSLSEVKVLKPTFYVKNALKQLKSTTLSKKHKLKILYRRFSGEDSKARFFVEHYMNVLDRGPSATDLARIQVVEGRKSADYRFIKKKQHSHSINYMISNNPLRHGVALKQYKWKKTGDTSYDGEDVLIIEGKKDEGKHRYFKLYIGIESFSIYRFETESPWLRTLYVYKKNNNGKLYLSYHNRKMTTKESLTDLQKRTLNTKKVKIQVSYSHEVYVLGLETDKSKMDFKPYGGWGIDIGDVEIKYNPFFWQNFSIPPETKFYKKHTQELVSLFGVPLEVQFKAVN